MFWVLCFLFCFTTNEASLYQCTVNKLRNQSMNERQIRQINIIKQLNKAQYKTSKIVESHVLNSRVQHRVKVIITVRMLV